MSLDAVLDRLRRLHPRTIDLSLGRIERLLARLDRPEDRLPPVVHVAGTNGKGSVLAFMRAMLEAAGQGVHVYTSPHLVRFNERIRLGGRPIADDEVIALLEECEAANGGEPITEFEIITAAAFLAFARVPADLLLMETGLGGRLDATNVVARPALAIVTPISMDHMQFLGRTIAAIAGEKAGILKPQVPAVVAPQPEDAAAVIAARAAAIGAPLLRAGQEWQADAAASGMSYRGRRWSLSLPAPALIGPHQVINAGTAIAALEALEDCPVSPGAIATGLRAVEWPARLQRLRSGPLPRSLPSGWELWLDGGHNAAAGEALAAMAARWRDRPLHLVFGMLASKDAEAFLRPLAPFVASLKAVAIPGEHAALSAEEAAAAARAVQIAAAAEESVEAAVRAVVEEAGPAARESRILICGSLYLAGAVLRQNG